MTHLKAALGAGLLACAAGAGAQSSVPDIKDPQGQTQSIRIPRGGVAPPLDMRIQDEGIMLPRTLREPEAEKAEPKPAAKPAPDTSGNKSSR